jgi:signal transduction histidine kinase
VNRSWSRIVGVGRQIVRDQQWAPTLAVILSLASLVEASIRADPGERGVAMLVALGATAPLAFADRRPVPMAVITTTCVFAMLADTTPITVAALVAEVVALYLVASRTSRLVSGFFAIPFLLNAMFPMGGDDSASSGLLVLVLAIGTLAIGDARRLRGAAIAERDASRQQLTDTLREQAAMEERARIARELHDVVAHHVSMIAVQAETARVATPDLSDESREQFGEIAGSARDALSEMRRLLGILREDAGGGAERAPQPGLEQLHELIDGARATGTTVRFTLSGQVVRVPPAVDLTAYRVAQEALTNARRHAPGAAVDIDIRFEADALQVFVRDDGPGAGPDAAEGNGLIGMRERIELVGGTLETGPDERGGFAVHATLPVTAEAAEPPDRSAWAPR